MITPTLVESDSRPPPSKHPVSDLSTGNVWGGARYPWYSELPAASSAWLVGSLVECAPVLLYTNQQAPFCHLPCSSHVIVTLIIGAKGSKFPFGQRTRIKWNCFPARQHRFSWYPQFSSSYSYWDWTQQELLRQLRDPAVATMKVAESVSSLVAPVGIEPMTCGLKGSTSLRFGQVVLSSLHQAHFR